MQAVSLHLQFVRFDNLSKSQVWNITCLLYTSHANKRAELEKVYSGDIAAAVGFKFTTTGDTICDEQHPVILESMEFPEPVIELAIEPKTKACLLYTSPLIILNNQRFFKLFLLI